MQLCNRRTSGFSLRGTSPPQGTRWRDSVTHYEGLLDTTAPRSHHQYSLTTPMEENKRGENNSPFHERPWTTGELEDEPTNDRDSMGTGFSLEGMLRRPWSAQVSLPNVRGSPSPDSDMVTAIDSKSKKHEVLTFFYFRGIVARHRSG